MVVSHSGTLASWEGTPRGGARWHCGYYAFDYGPGDFGLGLAKVHYDDGPVDPEPGQPYVLACFDPSDRMVSSILRIYDPADPFGGVAATGTGQSLAGKGLTIGITQRIRTGAAKDALLVAVGDSVVVCIRRIGGDSDG